MPGDIQLERDGAVAHVMLANAGKLNAMSRAMWRRLRAVFAAIQADEGVRCVIVHGQGATFCAGGDIAEYPAFRFDVASLRAFHEQDVWGGLQAMLDCDLPVLAKIRGNCMGAGLEIASCCDIRLSASGAHFGAPIARLGFPMAPQEAALVSAEVGKTTARQMLLEAAVLSAPEMLTRGFLTRVVADDALAEHTQATLLRMLALSPLAARLNKQTFRKQNCAPTLIQKAQDATNSESNDGVSGADAYAYASHPEHREGIRAFLEKRPPVF